MIGKPLRISFSFVAVGLALLGGEVLAQANAPVTSNSFAQNEPMVAINPADHRKLVAGCNDARVSGNYRLGWSWSDDGGSVWNFGGTFSVSGYSFGGDPVVDFDDAGTAYIVGLAYNFPTGATFPRDGSIFIAKSGDGGHTFSVFQKIIATGSGTSTYYDKPWLHVNPSNNHVHVAWAKRTNAFGASESIVIELVRSTDGGDTFSAPVQVSNFSPATGSNRSHGPQIDSSSATNVYVAWHTLEAGTLGQAGFQPPRIWVAESTNGGANFGAPQLAATAQNSLPNRFVSLGVHRSSGRLHVTYADRPQFPGQHDIKVATAPAVGGPWASSLVSDDTLDRSQFWPSLDVAPNGRVDVMWYDFRDDPNRLHVYYTFSEDGGATWAANRRLTDNNGFTPVSVFAGDYSTIASVDEKAYAVWMDNRMSNQEIYGVEVTHAPAVVLLFDTSGSMSWSHTGVPGVPADEQRLTLAKRAAIPFLEMIHDHYAGQVFFGIATFPPHPWTQSVGCVGQVVTPIVVADAASLDAATSTAPPGTIAGLVAEGNTPLLGGVAAARGMFTTEPKHAILLLSDGYHNCPSTVTPTDPTVTTLIGQLNAQGTRVYTIGFGRPTDVDHPLLNALAAQTLGQFYDVTGPAFDPTNWDPQTALQATYKAILVDFLGLDPITDPFGTITIRQRLSHPMPVTARASKVSFFLSWASEQAGRLELTVKASDGQPVPAGGAGVQVHQGPTHELVTVDSTFLRTPGKVGAAPWTMEIDASKLKTEQVKYQYGVFAASDLRLAPRVDARAFAPGATLSVTAELTEAGRPLTGLADVQVEVVRPDEGLGNWYARHKVTGAELAQVPAVIDGEAFPGRFRKARYLLEKRNVALPGRVGAGTLKLFDDGTHGDARADDGIYSNTFGDTAKEGGYTFRFSATGASGGAAFRREAEVHRYLTPAFSPDHSDIRFGESTVAAGVQRVSVVVTLKDPLGNHLGPGYAGAIQVSVDGGRAADPVEDNLDGTYTQTVELPVSVAPGARLHVKVGDATKTVPWEKAPPELPALFNWLTWLLLVLLVLLLFYVLLK